jgi:hypothetical protein
VSQGAAPADRPAQSVAHTRPTSLGTNPFQHVTNRAGQFLLGKRLSEQGHFSVPYAVPEEHVGRTRSCKVLLPAGAEPAPQEPFGGRPFLRASPRPSSTARSLFHRSRPPGPRSARRPP